MCVEAAKCVDTTGVPFEYSAASITNPFTVLCFVDIAQSGGHKTILHTAAASALVSTPRRKQKEGISLVQVCILDRPS